MIHRFEQLTTGVSQIYKNIQRIKKLEMRSFGLKGTHVINQLNESVPGLNLAYDEERDALEGLTAADLCTLCKEDKAGISRILSELLEHGFIQYVHAQASGETYRRHNARRRQASPDASKKRYRSKAVLTETGKKQAKKVNRLILRAVLEGGRDITAKERDTFYRVLYLISDNLEKFCEELEKSQGKITGKDMSNHEQN